MNTIEILSNFLKGNEVTVITEKQKAWLLGQAIREGIKHDNDGFSDTIYFTDCHYTLRNCKTHVAGYGGTRGTKVVQGKYKLEKMYRIKFDTTGLTGVYHNCDLTHFKKEGHLFTIINFL